MASAPTAAASPSRPARPPRPKAAVPLAAYQRRAIEDRARFLFRLWPRQCGKSWGLALKCVLETAETGKPWVWLSSGGRMSQELIEAGGGEPPGGGRGAEGR